MKLVAAIIVLAASGVYAWRNFSAPTAVTSANSRMFVCSETGKSFPYELQIGEMEPIKSPFSGKNTAYEAEKCYWKKDGSGFKAKKKPTYVLLNRRMGKEEKTYCPDCGKEVVGHNPRPPKELMESADEE